MPMLREAQWHSPVLGRNLSLPAEIMAPSHTFGLVHLGVGRVINWPLIHAVAAETSTSPGSHATGPGARFRMPQAVFRPGGPVQPVTGERDLEAFRICSPCMMIEQESDETDNSSRATTAPPATYETATAISAMPVWPLPGHPLALPLRDRVRTVRVPGLGAATVVAAAGLPAAPRGLRPALAGWDTTEYVFPHRYLAAQRASTQAHPRQPHQTP
jgi:hypothetical protein